MAQDGTPLFGVFATRLSTKAAYNPTRDFQFSPDGRALRTVENGHVRVHVLTGSTQSHAHSSALRRRHPLTRLTGYVRGEHVLELRREDGWNDDVEGPANGELVGFESFPGFRLFASAFDDQGQRGAVLAQCMRTGRNAIIVFPEPDLFP